MLTRQQIRDYAVTIAALGFPVSPSPVGSTPLFGQLSGTPPQNSPSRIYVSNSRTNEACAMFSGLCMSSSGGTIRLIHIMPGGWEIALTKIRAATERFRVAHAAMLALVPALNEEPISEQVSLVKQMLLAGRFSGMEASIAELSSILLKEPLSAFGKWGRSSSPMDSSFQAPEQGRGNFLFAAFRPIPGSHGVDNPLGHNLPFTMDSIMVPESSNFGDEPSDSYYRGLTLRTHRRVIRGQVYTELRAARLNAISIRFPELFVPALPEFFTEFHQYESATESLVEVPGQNPLPVSTVLVCSTVSEIVVDVLQNLFSLPPDAT